MSHERGNNASRKRATLTRAILGESMKGDIVECRNCGKSFDHRRKDHFFCDEHCRWEFWSRIHPRIVIGRGFKIVPDEPGGNRKSTEGQNRC
jgi:hypothetical protein